MGQQHLESQVDTASQIHLAPLGKGVGFARSERHRSAGARAGACAAGLHERALGAAHVTDPEAPGPVLYLDVRARHVQKVVARKTHLVVLGAIIHLVTS